MADFKFPCPSCQQNIVCDELWCGQEIQCPSCKTELVVPAQPGSSSSSLVPPPPPAGAAPKLSIGRHQPATSAAAPGGQRFIPGVRPPARPQKAKKGQAALKFLKIGVALVVLGAGGYFGYDWWTKRQAKADAEAATAANAASAAAKAANPPAEKPLPVLPATWTLDVDAAKIPEGQANGALGGTNFLVESALLSRSGTAQVLDLRQGTGPDRQFMIYLHLNAGETLTGHNWTVSQEMKGAAVPRVLKRWKASSNGALQQKFFSTGYAMKLEIGQAANDGAISGRIFLALPDPEQSVVAGLFKILPASTEATAPSVGTQAPSPSGPPTADKAAFDKRYGIQKR